MNATSQDYLRLFEPDGSWIKRPDYMVLAALPDPDPRSIEHIYTSLIKEDELNPDASAESLTRFGKNIKKHYLERNNVRRVSAGLVVLELCRLAQALDKPPSITAAQKLVAYQRHQERKSATLDTAVREIKKYWSVFRRTLHLQAVAAYEPNLIAQLEGDEAATARFLGLARAFENFIGLNVASERFVWSPIRIPEEIPVVKKIEMVPISEQRLKEAGVT